MNPKGNDREARIITRISGTASCSIPLCILCIRGKGAKSSLKIIKTTEISDYTSIIRCRNSLPGDCLSTDQFKCRKGRLPNTKSREDTQNIYWGGIVFVDNSSSRISIYNQVSLGSTYTIISKNIYELEASKVGVKVATHRGDNGLYKSTSFQNELKRRHHKINFSGVGVHDQNGVVERAIGKVAKSERVTMLHQALLWPRHFDV